MICLLPKIFCFCLFNRTTMSCSLNNKKCQFYLNIEPVTMHVKTIYRSTKGQKTDNTEIVNRTKTSFNVSFSFLSLLSLLIYRLYGLTNIINFVQWNKHRFCLWELVFTVQMLLLVLYTVFETLITVAPSWTNNSLKNLRSWTWPHSSFLF